MHTGLQAVIELKMIKEQKNVQAEMKRKTQAHDNQLNHWIGITLSNHEKYPVKSSSNVNLKKITVTFIPISGQLW